MVGCRVQSSRPLDFAYDPLYTVSGSKDYCKAALLAKMSEAKFQICPIFPNMFSEMPNYPSQQLVRRRTTTTPTFVMRYKLLGKEPIQRKTVDVAGADRPKYFHTPLVNLRLGDAVPQLRFQDESPREKSGNSKVKKKTKKVQTQFRESSAQTSPWQPSFVVTGDTEPELLMLDFLKWGSGLPAGMHEVKLIERARMKRAWEKTFEGEGAGNLGNRRDLIEAMERDEWAFREQEIQDVQNLRLELLEQMLNELHVKAKTRGEAKLKMFAELRHAEKDEKLRKLNKKTARELRKLEMEQAGVNKKYHAVDAITEHVDRTSDLYGPQRRFGEHPKRWHQIIDDCLMRYKAQFLGVEDFSTLPSWLDQATKMKDCCCVKLPGTRLCIKETKWTTPVLKQLHEELKTLRDATATKWRSSLRTRIFSAESECHTPEAAAIPDQEEDLFQAIILLQAVIKGRASQTLIYEGRDRCRQLIMELKQSHGLLEGQKTEINEEKLKITLGQRDDYVKDDRMRKLQANLGKLQGTVVGSLLDFLNKELKRLLEERRAHAMCLLLERERHDREAAEAGRRQLELRRRREHDEIFKQIIKVDQDTVDLYLEDIIKEGMDFASDAEAKEYVTKLAAKIDDDAYKTLEEAKLSMNEEEELVANLVHHFVLPEVQKEFVRKRIMMKQKENLRTVHDALYTEIEEELPSSDDANIPPEL